MRTADAGAFGDPDALDTLLSSALAGVRDTEGAELFAFGNPWGPEPDELDNISIFCLDAAFTTFT